MNLAALIQSQNLATLLQALAPASELAVGKTVEARLLSLAGDGTAIALVDNTRISLVLAGPEAKQATLQPGATLVLRIDATEEPQAGLKATLLEIRPPATAQPPRQTLPTDPPAASLATTPGATAPTPVTTSPATVLAALQRANLSLDPSAPPLATTPGASAPIPATTSPAPALTAPQRPSVSQPLPASQPAETVAAEAPVATPRSVVGPLLGAALARQDSLAPLLANLRGLAEGSIALVLPKPLLAAIDRVLVQPIPVERKPLTAQVLKEAVQGSGLFLEARQASGQAPPPRGDLKASLLALRESLVPLIDALSMRPSAANSGPVERAQQAAREQLARLEQPMTGPEQQSRPAPPRRDGPLAPQNIAEPSLSAGEKPLAIAETLLDQTDAALDRIKLGQYASLPLEGARADQAQNQRWLTEIPLAFHQGSAVLPLQIEKEPPRRDANGVTPPLWRIRFALDVEPMGPLQGVVTLQGRSVGVTLWAEREETSRMLRGASPGLEAALVDAEFDKGVIDIHTGQPRVAQPTAGQFLDRLS
ncbi:flagellar hook-length control protein FliK [Bosea lathyri]|uniref:Hook-length control protein FliK n=1 Tax=Bosea lathyri TaxID=1036778 RepID=A0A1H5X3P4_9HYPH|nr:flagellar hook-length control protein FliK [Bosea lathyri]SEG05980.1 hook-length control protein FliK [Bosea lathyri]